MITEKRSFSVIMTVYDQSSELKENLPAFLTQEYDAAYEVIVVDESSTDDTGDVLKRFKLDYANLYTTFLPKPNRLVTRKKLAISIGAKAANNEWLIIADINKKPTEPDLLSAINEVMDHSTELILGYVGKKRVRLQPFSSVDDASKLIMRLERKQNYAKGSYAFGRYDFIIVRKDLIYDMLKFYERKTSVIGNLGSGFSVFCKNLFSRSGTIKLQTT